jgi:hypothetical protein
MEKLRAKISADGSTQFGPRIPDVAELISLYEAELDTLRAGVVADDVVTDLIDRLERHKAAMEGVSNLKIGPRVVVEDFSDCIAMLLYLRRIISGTSRSRAETLEECAKVAEAYTANYKRLYAAATDDEDLAAYARAFHAASDITKAIRALSPPIGSGTT